MKYAPYSPSAISTFQQCPRKFKFYKIEKVQVPKRDTKALTRGKIIHSFLEHQPVSWKEKIDILKKDKDIRTSKYFNKNIIKDCIKVYDDFIQTPLGKEIFSFKNLANELHCGLKIENKQIVPCGYNDMYAFFRGKIDAVFVNENTDEIYVIDWKTGKDRSDGIYKQNPEQLLYYGTWYFHNFPVDKINIKYIFVEHGTYLEYPMYRENMDQYNKVLLQNINNIEKCEDFYKVESGLCQYCDYYDLCNKEK